jgi:hypothetical protein
MALLKFKAVGHCLAVIALAIVLLPMVAHGPTGDMSRYLPARIFSEGVDGKDQIALVSAAATILVSVALAACVWATALAIWRRVPIGGPRK